MTRVQIFCYIHRMTSLELLKTNRKILLLENMLNAELSKSNISESKLTKYEKQLLLLLSQLKNETLIKAKERFRLVTN